MAGWGRSSWGSSRWGIGDILRGHIPTSPEFPSADVNISTIAILPDYLEVSITKGAPWIIYDPTALGLRVMNDGGVETAISIDLETSESWTLEVTFRPDKLPPDLNHLDTYRLFIGAYDMQGPGCGLAISRAGLAIMPAPIGAAFPIPGSQSLIPEGSDYYTIRIAVSAELDVTNIYVTKTSLIPTKGHQLRFTTNAIQSPPDSSDGVIIDPLGTGPIPVQITLQTVRFNGHSILIPNQRPVAVPGPDQGVPVGATVRFDGSGSYDPEGSPLTYFWSLIDAPDGSQFKISGTGGVTSPDFNNNGFTYFLDDPDIGGLSNTGMFSEDNAPVLQPGDTLIVGDQQYTVAVGVAGQIPMWVLDLVTSRWVRNVAGGGWIDTRIAITEELLPDDLSNQSWVIYHSATFFDDQTHSIPTATPDAAGLYEPQLVVNDGELDSIPEFALLNVAQTSLTMGVIPDVSFIWNHLSNFWNLLEDRAKVDTVWSGFAQAAANILLAAWQIDYNKSLKDIQRVFQRRWLSYSAFLADDPNTSVIRLVRAPIVSTSLSPTVDVAGLTLEFVFDAGRIETVQFVGTPGEPLSVADIVTQINNQLGFSTKYPLATVVHIEAPSVDVIQLSYPTLLQIASAGTANGYFGWDYPTYIQNDLHGVFGLAAGQKFSVEYDRGLNLVSAGVDNSDLLIVATDGVYRIITPSTSSIVYDIKVVLDSTDLTLAESIPPAITYTSWLIPSTVTSTINDFNEQVVAAGDLARFEVAPIATDIPVIVLCPILGVLGKQIGFDPAPLLMHYNGRPEDFNTNFVGVSRLTNVPVDALVVEIPRLQEVIKDPPSYLTGNKDYIITKINGHNTIQFAPGTYSIGDPPPDTLWAEITYLDNRPAIEANFGTLVSLPVSESTGISGSLDYLSAVRGLWYTYFGGPSVENIRIGIQILLGLPFSEEAAIVQSINPNFSAKQGRIFLQDQSNPTIVRGYFYPTVSKLGLASRADAGVVYIGKKITLSTAPAVDWAPGDTITGQISSATALVVSKVSSLVYQIDPIIGQFILGETVGVTGVPTKLAIQNSTHPTFSNVTIKNDPTLISVGDKISQFAPLSTGVEVLDWLNGVEWGIPYKTVFSEVEKFFRFAIRANVDAFDLANFEFAIKFMLGFKPHYTYPTFILLKNVATPPDTIDVLDELTTVVRKLIVSTPDTLNIGAYRYDDDIAGEAFNSPHGSLCADGVCQQQFDAPTFGKPYFGFDRPLLFPDMQMSVIASDTLSGTPRFDSIWAYDDGGGTDLLPLSGPAPTPPPPPYGPLVGLISFDMGLPGGPPGLIGVYSRGWYL